jgi:hypothetical protein
MNGGPNSNGIRSSISAVDLSSATASSGRPSARYSSADSCCASTRDTSGYDTPTRAPSRSAMITSRRRVTSSASTMPPSISPSCRNSKAVAYAFCSRVALSGAVRANSFAAGPPQSSVSSMYRDRIDTNERTTGMLASGADASAWQSRRMRSASASRPCCR